MAVAYVIEVDGIDGLDLDEIPAKTQRNLRRAVNKAAVGARAESSRRMRAQINFPASYISDRSGRLSVRQARGAETEAAVTARFRPTSLARFATSKVGSSRGVTVRVAPGVSRRMSRAFQIKLRAGRAPIETKFNLGVAVRLKEGETIRRKREMKQIGKGLYLLYGPSVSQAFQFIAEEVRPQTAEALAAEFSRLMDLDLD